MEDWTKLPDKDVFGGAGEQPGSQAAYWREIEIQRRLYLLQRELLAAQVEATAAQKAAVDEQRAATAEQRQAIGIMKGQSRLMLASTIAAFLAAAATLGAAFIK